MFTKLVWAAIGAAAGYYVAKRQLHDYYEARLQKETEDVRYFFQEKHDAKLKSVMEDNERSMSEMDKPSEVLDETGTDVETGFAEGLLSDEATKALTDYQGISVAPSTLAQEMDLVGNIARRKVQEAITIEEEAREAEELDAATKTHEEPGPRLINFTMYDANEGDYEQHTVTYFAKGGEVADENDQKLSKETVDKHIGDYNLEQLGENRTTIYVRNDRYKMDYEIVWDPNSYDVSVLGKTG